MKTIAIYGTDQCSDTRDALLFCLGHRLPFVQRDTAEKAMRLELMGRIERRPAGVTIFAGDIEIVDGVPGLEKAHATGALQQILGGH